MRAPCIADFRVGHLGAIHQKRCRIDGETTQQPDLLEPEPGAEDEPLDAGGLGVFECPHGHFAGRFEIVEHVDSH